MDINNEKTAKSMLDLIEELIKQQLDSKDQVALCQIASPGSDGRYNVYVVPDDTNVIHDIPNKFGFDLNTGDYVYVYKVGNQFAQSFIFAKVGENLDLRDKLNQLVLENGGVLSPSGFERGSIAQGARGESGLGGPNIEIPDKVAFAAIADKVENALTIGGKTFNGSEAVEVTAADLGALTEIPQATEVTLGGIKIGHTATANEAALKLDTEGRAYVDVPAAIAYSAKENGGLEMDANHAFSIKEVSTDLLKQGTKTLILDGGTAAE